MTMLAGASAVDITPGVGIAMGGYGARKGNARAVHDGLHVRTLVLSDGTVTLALAICDLVGVGPDIVETARAIVADECGIPASHVLVGATHTHSGPASVRTEDSSGYAQTTARKVAGSIQMAQAALQPVTLRLGSVGVASISQNRRHPDGPIETVARVLVAQPSDDPQAEPVATLVNYACHATVLEADNLDYSADFPGAMAAFVEQSLGGTAIYLQGAAGDINPVWLRHDFAETDRIGGILGAAAVRTAHELRAVGDVQRVVNLSWSEDLPVAAAEVGTVLESSSLAATQHVLELPQRPLPPRDVIGKEIKSLEVELEQVSAADATLIRRLRPRLNQLRMEWLFAGREGRSGERTESVEIQAMRLSPTCALVALPGEFLVEIGEEIRAHAPVPEVLIAGYSNGYVGYVPRAEDFPQGGYEVGCARMGESAAAEVVTAARDALAELFTSAPVADPRSDEAIAGPD